MTIFLVSIIVRNYTSAWSVHVFTLLSLECMHLFICFSSPDLANDRCSKARGRRRSLKRRVWRQSGDRARRFSSWLFDVLGDGGEENGCERRRGTLLWARCVCVKEPRWVLFFPLCGFSPSKLARAIKSQRGERGTGKTGRQISLGSFLSCLSFFFTLQLIFFLSQYQPEATADTL